MAAGKNKLTRYARIYVGGFDLSGDARNLDALDSMMGEADMTGWSNTFREFLADMRMSMGVRGFTALANDTAVTGAHTLLKTPTGGARQQVSVLLGGGAAPAAGDIAYLLTGVDISDAMAWDGQAAIIRADFLPYPGYMAGKPWGWVLMPSTSLTETTNGTAVDNVASSALGAHANLHILATDSGNFAFTIEHSANGVDWATLGTAFTADGSAVTSEYKTFAAGTINQHVRFVATRTGGTCTAVCTFARY